MRIEKLLGRLNKDRGPSKKEQAAADMLNRFVAKCLASGVTPTEDPDTHAKTYVFQKGQRGEEKKITVAFGLTQSTMRRDEGKDYWEKITVARTEKGQWEATLIKSTVEKPSVDINELSLSADLMLERIPVAPAAPPVES